MIGNSAESDAVSTRGFQGASNFVSLGIADHEGCKRLLQRVGRAMLLFKSSKGHFFQFELFAKRFFKNPYHLKEGKWFRPAHLEDNRRVLRLNGSGHSK